MTDHNPKIEIDPSLMDEALEAVEDPKSKNAAKENSKSETDEPEPGADEYKDRWIRAVADFENFRKRAQKEKADLLTYGNENLLKELLPVLDNFERALSTVPAGTKDPFCQGVQMIHSQLMNALERFGLKSESALGKTFDPNLHEAMSYKEDSSALPHTILEEHQKMFFLNKKLIRPALVTVSKGDLSDEAPTTEISPEDVN
jgi:molecular chaperone GrpE (heat shock protein)